MTKYTLQPNPTDSDYYDKVIKSYSQILPHKHLLSTVWVATIHRDHLDTDLKNKIKADGEVEIEFKITE